LAEALIVSARRDVAEGVRRRVDELGFDVVTMTATSARRIAEAYARWGKGVHPAGLNLSDCFAYEFAK
jgi:ribonuclease VapC